MAMVGLFWITEGCVYLGAKPAGAGPGVRLTEGGVEILGTGQGGRSWGWDEVRGWTCGTWPCGRPGGGWRPWRSTRSSC